MKVTVFHWNLNKDRSHLSSEDAALHLAVSFGKQEAVEAAMRREATNQDPFMTLDKVADVEVKSLEQVFELTNHIDSDWTKNAGVAAVPGQHRSTSVGDVYLLDSDFYCVSMVGLKKLQIDAPAQMQEPAEAMSSPRG